jgi:hypothetical protein
MSEDRTLLIKDMGNVTDENVFTFEYTIKTVLELIEMDDIDISIIKEFPFQA